MVDLIESKIPAKTLAEYTIQQNNQVAQDQSFDKHLQTLQYLLHRGFAFPF